MLDWLLDALRAHFGPLVAPLWESRSFWRGATLGLVALVVAAVLLERQADGGEQL